MGQCLSERARCHSAGAACASHTIGTAAGPSSRLQTRRHASASMVDMIKEKNAENPVMVYSKSYCPFCASVKGLFDDLEVQYKVVELDQIGAAFSEMCAQCVLTSSCDGCLHRCRCLQTSADICMQAQCLRHMLSRPSRRSVYLAPHLLTWHKATLQQVTSTSMSFCVHR